jgi:hypothetical protein
MIEQIDSERASVAGRKRHFGTRRNRAMKAARCETDMTVAQEDVQVFAELRSLHRTIAC